MLYDSYGDGGTYYNVSWNGNTVASGTQDNNELEYLMCGLITCEQNQSLFEIPWAYNQYFCWLLLDTMNKALTTGQSHNQKNKYRGCITVQSDECALLLLYDGSDDNNEIDYGVS